LSFFVFCIGEFEGEKRVLEKPFFLPHPSLPPSNTAADRFLKLEILRNFSLLKIKTNLVYSVLIGVRKGKLKNLF
ncbi:MAG: hypothetical protein AAF849_22750, partial [Bacteroidota bacterium]